MLNAATPDFLAHLAHEIPDLGLIPPRPDHLEEPRGRYKGIAAAVARPRRVEDVSALLKACNIARVPVIPYGGGTGLVGGQIIEDGPVPILLSMERMTQIRETAPGDNVMVAEAGVILADVQRAADHAERLFPLALASDGSCRIGGVLSTNAGGVNVLRYGNARDLVLGLEAVLADGTIIHGLKHLRKDNTGYDLRHLLIGAEGTLGVITAASLRLFPRPAERATAFLAVNSPADALALLHRLQGHLGEVVSAFELIGRAGLDFLAETVPHITHPLETRPDWMVLVDVGGAPGIGEKLEEALAVDMEAGHVTDAVIAQNESQRTALWDVRETIPEANRLIGSISSHDISVPLSRLQEFITTGTDVVAQIMPDARINCFGHVGDGNLHYNVYPAKGRKRAEYDDLRGAVKDAVHALAHSFGGSVSAEHGIGRLKTGDVARFGDPGRILAMRAIKAALDPNGILNPGAVLPTK